MPRYAPEEDSGEDRYYEADLDRQRMRAVGWVVGGVPMNKKQSEWLEGRRAAEEAAASQREATQSSDLAPLEYGGHSSSQSSERGTRDATTPAKRAVQLYSESEKNWCPMEATFDTGTRENWVSKGTVAQLKCSTEQVKAETYYTFTGETLESSKVIRDVRWCIDTGSGSGNKSRWADFRVAPEGAPFAVLFGRDLIFSEDIFSFKDAALILIKGDESAATKKTKEENRERAEAEAHALAAKRHAAVAKQQAKDRHSSSSQKKKK